MNIFKIILDICLLRGRAQDLPASWGWLGLMAAASVLVNSFGLPAQGLNIAHVLFIVSQVALFGAVIWSILRVRGFPERWMQSMMALYAVDAVFNIMLLPLLPALLEMVKRGPEATPGWEIFALLALSGWLLLIIARVLREATEWPLALTFLTGFTSLLVVRMLGQLLVPLFGLTAQT